MLSSADANGPHSQLFFNIVWILSWVEQQNIVEVQILQILAVTLACKTILLRFDVLVPSKVRVVSGGCEFCAHEHLSHGQWLTTWIQGP